MSQITYLSAALMRKNIADFRYRAVNRFIYKLVVYTQLLNLARQRIASHA